MLCVVPPDRLSQQLSGAADVEFVFDARAISLDRLDADAEVFGDLPRADALAELLENLELAIAQSLDGGAPERRAAERLAGQHFGRLLADVELALEYAAD